MTNPLKAIYSYLLMLKASKYQGKSDFHEVIEIAERARAINPRSRLALLFLGDDYYRIGEYDRAVEVLEEALRLYPKEFHYNLLMAMSLAKKKEPGSKIVPFLRTYLNEKPSGASQFPMFVKVLMRILRKGADLDSYAEYIDDWSDRRAAWAESVVAEYERQQEG